MTLAVDSRQPWTASNKLEILKRQGKPELAEVFVARLRGDDKHLIEFVDGRDSRFPRSAKAVIIVSSQFGCPVGCLMCDAGTHFYGNLDAEEVLAQIEWVLARHEGEEIRKCPKLKIHFARMGEPSLNPAVLEVLETLPLKYDLPGLLPVVATVAPAAAGAWFDRLLTIKNRFYAGGYFQLQFSVNSTAESVRRRLMPISQWSLPEIAAFGSRWWAPGDRKITLNFAPVEGLPVQPEVIADNFDAGRYLIKLTPVNPTQAAAKNELAPLITAAAPDRAEKLIADFRRQGFEVLLSIGDPEENVIGSNCGMAVRSMAAQPA